MLKLKIFLAYTGLSSITGMITCYNAIKDKEIPTLEKYYVVFMTGAAFTFPLSLPVTIAMSYREKQ